MQELAITKDIKRIVFVGDVHALRDDITPEYTATDLVMDTIRKASELAGQDGLVVQVGDMFDVHRPDKFTEIELAKAIMFSGTRWIGISGNHDYPAGGAANDCRGAVGDSPNTLLEKATHGMYLHLDFHVVTAGNVAIFMVPFFRREEEFLMYMEQEVLPCVARAQDSGRQTVLVMHQYVDFEVKGSKISPRLNVFKLFDLVFNGHIHKSSVTGNWIQTGAACAVKETDAGIRPRMWELTGKMLNPIPCPLLDPWGTRWTTSEKKAEFSKPVFRDSVKDDTKEEKAEFIKKAAQLEELPEGVVPEEFTGGKTAKAFKFLEVTVEGFRSWVRETGYRLDLDGGLNLIRAKVGAGKSTLFEAPYWAFTGDVLKEDGKQEDLPTEEHLRGQSWRGTRVCVKIEKDGRMLTVSRHIQFRGDTFGFKGGDSLMLTEELPNGEQVTDAAKILGVQATEVDNKTKLTKALCEWLGITRESYTTSILFDPQKCRIAQGSQADLRAIFEPLMGVGWIDTMKANADARIAGAKVDTARLEGELKLARTGVDNADAMERELLAQKEAAVETEMARLDRAMACRALEIEAHEGQLEEMRGKRRILEDALKLRRTELEEAEESMPESPEGLKAKASELAAETVKAEALLEQARRNLKEAKMEPEPEHVVNLRAKLAEAQGNVKACHVDLTRETITLERAENTLAAFLQKVEGEGKCPTCGQDLKDPDHVKAEGDAKRERVAEVAKILEDLRTEKAGHQEDVEKLTAKLEEAVAKVQEERAEVIRDLEAEVSEAQAEAERAEDRLLAARIKVKDVQRVFDTHAEAVKDARAELDKIKQGIANYKTREETTQERIADLMDNQPADEHVKQARAELEDFRSTMGSRVLDMQVKLEEAQARMDAHLAQVKSYEVIAKKCAANGPLRAQLIGSRLDAINRHAWEWAALVGTTVEVRMDDSGRYTVHLLVAGRERPARKASTGQLLIANLILVRAIHALSRNVVLDTNVLFLDEPFSNVDPATIRLLSPLLSEGDVSVHCITHAQDMDLRGAHVVMIEGGTKEPSRFA